MFKKIKKWGKLTLWGLADIYRHMGDMYLTAGQMMASMYTPQKKYYAHLKYDKDDTLFRHTVKITQNGKTIEKDWDDLSPELKKKWEELYGDVDRLWVSVDDVWGNFWNEVDKEYERQNKAAISPVVERL